MFVRICLIYDFTTSLRLLGYLSKGVLQVMSQWKEMGTLTKLDNLKSSLRKNNVTSSLKIESLSALREPGEISLGSPVGIMCLV